MLNYVHQATPSLRLLLEGVEVPCTGCALDAQVGKPATAQLSLPWSSKARYLKPRTTAHVFVDGRLAFVGEVLTVNEKDSVGGQVTVLSCVDNSYYWAQAKVYYVTSFPRVFGPSRFEIINNVSGYTKKTSFEQAVLAPSHYIIKSLRKSSRLYPGIRGVLGGMVRLLEDLGGMHDKVANPFFSAAEARLRILQQIGASKEDTTAKKLLGTYSANKYVKRLVKRMGNRVDYATIIDAILPLIHYIRAPVLFPTLSEPYSYTAKLPVTVKTGISNKDTLSSRVALLQGLRAALASSLGAQSGEKFKEGRQEVYEAFRRYASNSTDAEVGTNGSVRAWIAEHAPKDKQLTFLHGVGWEFYAAKRIKQNGLVATLKSATPAEYDTVERLHFGDLKRKVNSALEHYGQKVTSKTVMQERTVQMPERLPTTMFFPNIFFAPPPKSNLVFEDDYTSFSHNKDFARQITRLLVVKEPQKDFLGPPPLPFSTRYYVVPAVKDVYKEQYASKARSDPSLLLGHEIYTGIIPDFISMEDLAVFKATHRKQKRKRKPPPTEGRIDESRIVSEARSLGRSIGKAVADKVDEIEETVKDALGLSETKSTRKKDDTKGAQDRHGKYIDDYVEAYANYEFFLRRFAARTASVSGRFMPDLVVGLPCAIFKKGQVVVGQLQALHHEITPDGSSTSLSLGFCRVVDEEDLLGLNEETIKSKGKAKQIIEVQAVVRVEGHGVLSDVNTATTITHSLILKGPKNVKNKPLSALPGKYRRRFERALKAIALDRAKKDLTEHDITLNETFVIPGEKSEVVGTREVAFEEVVRPPWLDPIYNNDRIGGVYYDIIGCGSVTDGVRFQTVDAVKTLNAATVDGGLKKLLTAYRAVKEFGGSTADFAADVRRREAASITEVMGDPNDAGSYRVEDGEVRISERTTDKTAFHAAAVGTMTIKGLPPGLDPRPSRRKAVLAYAASFQDRDDIVSLPGRHTAS